MQIGMGLSLAIEQVPGEGAALSDPRLFNNDALTNWYRVDDLLTIAYSVRDAV